MATIGLKIAQDPNTSDSLSLADTLAKGIFGDPEAQMRAKALASEVGVRMASRDKLIADTGFVSAKTKTEQDAEAARLRAGPLVGEAGAAAVPAIVDANDAHAVAVHNALVERERALGPVLVLGDNPNAVAEGVNKNYGGAILSAATSNPAIVSGDALRIAGGLATGSAPTTSTVWSAGDTSGVDAAARQKIIEESAPKPFQPKDVTYRGQPGIVRLDAAGNPVYTGAAGTQTTPEKPNLVDLPGGGKGTLIFDAQGNPAGVQTLPGAESRPEKQEIVDLPNGGKGAVIRDAQGNILGTIPIPGAGAVTKLVTVGKDTAQQNPDGSLTTPTVQGRPAEPPPSVFGGNSTTDEALNFTTGLGVKMQDTTYKPTYQEAATYASAYNHLYEQPKPQEFKRADGSTGINWVNSPPPAGSLTPAQVFARLTGQPTPVQTPPVQTPPVQTPPVQTPPVQTPPVQTPPVVEGPRGTVVTQDLTGPTPRTSLTAEQEKAQGYLTMGHEANAILSKLTPKTVPSGWDIGKAQYASSPGLTNSLVGWATSDAAKKYNGAAKAFVEAYARPATGATISPADYQNFYGAMIPLPTDPQSEFDRKARLRADLEQVWANGSGFPDEASRDAWFAKHGVARTKTDAAPPRTDGGDAAPPKAPQTMKDAWSHMSKDAKARAVQRYGQ